MNPGSPVGFCVLRVPFFLEPEYSTDEKFGETNRVRLIRKYSPSLSKELSLPGSPPPPHLNPVTGDQALLGYRPAVPSLSLS